MTPIHLFIYSVFEILFFVVFAFIVGSKKRSCAEDGIGDAFAAMFLLFLTAPGVVGILWSIGWAIKNAW